MFVGKKIESNTVKLMPTTIIISKKTVFEEAAQITQPSSVVLSEVKGIAKESNLVIKTKEKNEIEVQKKPRQYNRLQNQTEKIYKSKPTPLNSIHIQSKTNIKSTEKKNQDKKVNKKISKTQKKQPIRQSKPNNNIEKQQQQKSSILSKQKEAKLLQVNRQPKQDDCYNRQPLIQQDEFNQIDDEDQVQFARQFLPNPLPHNEIFGQMLQFQDSLLEPQYFPPQQHKNEFIPQEYSFNQPSENLQLNMQLFELNAEELLALDYLTI